jgi:hypothetical protein
VREELPADPDLEKTRQRAREFIERMHAQRQREHGDKI